VYAWLIAALTCVVFATVTHAQPQPGDAEDPEDTSAPETDASPAPSPPTSDPVPPSEQPDASRARPPTSALAGAVMRMGARQRELYIPAHEAGLATVQRARAICEQRTTPPPQIARLSAGDAQTADIADDLGTTLARLRDPQSVRTLVQERTALLAEIEENRSNAYAGIRILIERNNELMRSTSPSSRLDLPAAADILARQLALVAIRDAYREAAALDEEFAIVTAELAYLERRLASLTATRSAAPGGSVGDATIAAIQEEISAGRQRLVNETELTDQLEAEAERQRRAAAEARARARNEQEREIAETADRLSDELGAVAQARRGAEQQQATITARREEFLAQQDDFRHRFATLVETRDTTESRAALADSLFATITRQRAETRGRAMDVRRTVDQHNLTIRQLEGQLYETRAALDMVGVDGTTTPDDPLYAQLRDVRQQAVDVAQRRLDLATWQQELDREEWTLTRQQVYFFARLSDGLVPYLSPVKRKALFALNASNFSNEKLNIRDRLLGLSLVFRDRIRRFDEFRAWLTSLSGIFQVLKLSVAALLILGLFAGLLRYRDRGIVWSLDRVERFRWARKRNTLVLKIAEILRDSAKLVFVYFACSFVIRQITTDLEEIIVAERLLQNIILYFLVMRVARTLVLPRSTRQRTGTDARDIANFGIDLFAIPERSARLVILTLQIWLIYTISTSSLLDLTRFVFGESFTTFWVGRLFFWAHVILIYSICWFWRDIIVDSTLRVTKRGDSRMADLLRAHKDRVYSVLFLVFLAAYVLVVETARVGRAWAAKTRLSRQIRNFVFRKRVERAQAQQTQGRADESSADVISLPEDYVALFDPLNPCSPEMRVGRDQALDRITNLKREWARDPDLSGAAVVLGEFGIGKTTFLDHFVESLTESDLPVLRRTMVRRRTQPEEVYELIAEMFGFEAPRTEALLLEKLTAEEPRTVIIDDCQHLFLRTINGFRGLDAFLRLVSLTGRRMFWVLAFDSYAWQFLNRVRDRRHYFHLIIDLPRLKEEHVQELIEIRNEHAQVTADFTNLLDADDDDDDGNIFEVVRTAAGYYRLLQEYAEGNPSVVKFYWLRSVRAVDANNVRVSLFDRPPPAQMKALTPTQRFALTALAQHGSMHVDELCLVIAADADEVELDIEQLLKDRFVVRNPDRTVRISVEYLRPILLELRNRNMLYYGK